MSEKPEALRLADALSVVLQQSDTEDNVIHVARWFVEDSAAELRRLHAENETLRQQHLAAHNNSAALMGALTQISLLTDLGGEVADYADVVDAVRRLHALNGELLEALKHLHDATWLISRHQDLYDIAVSKARAAIAKAEGQG